MAESGKKTAASAKPSEKETKKGPNGFVRFLNKTKKYLKDCKGEIKRIVWPTPKATFKSTGVVLVVVAAVCVFVFLLDFSFMKLLGLVMEVSQ